MRTNTDTSRTLRHLLGAMEAQRVVTLRYVDRDGKVSRRAVELHAVEVTASGALVVKGWCRRRGDVRTFRLDRVTAYRLHRVTHLADYRCPVTPVADPVTTDELGDVVAVRGWTTAYTLAA
ncbi:WYL domain-containing protein [Nocardiopsis flavescens]|uniref:WYL domain-containing protein n=1 Tax=Nocardiopsis flavescens TaxID=758803 RepID=A0A1M6KF82_9ACTN|nr:WYL domain-containing protein [Nocardiopsis flavescens]SHJ57613.1 WYL domain-containing protein [Nocardiopsis flavescens]